MRTIIYLLVTVPAVFSISVSLTKDESNLYCPTQDMNHWNAIIFNRFQVNNTNDASMRGIDGALIVGQASSISNYKINHRNAPKACLSQYNESIPVHEYGLYGNIKHLEGIDVNGAIQLTRFHPQSRVTQTSQNCRLRAVLSDTDLTHQYKSIAEDISSQFANQKTTHVLQKNGTVTSTGKHHADFNFVNFASCVDQVCKDINEDTHLSDPVLVFSRNNVENASWPMDKPIVFNIPVIQGTTFEISSKYDVMADLTGCQTIWNFFSVDKQGNVLQSRNDTLFTINRISNHLLEGVVLAVDGTIRDGSEGGFAGQLVANNYEWLDLHKGNSIQSFKTSCTNACWPKKLQSTPVTTEYIVGKADLKYAHSQYAQEHSMQPQAFFDQDENDVFTLCPEDYEKYKDYLREQIPCNYQHITVKTEEKEFTSTIYTHTETLTLSTREIKTLTLPYKELETVYEPVVSQMYTSTSVSEIRYIAQVQPIRTTLVRFNIVQNALQTIVAY